MVDLLHSCPRIICFALLLRRLISIRLQGDRGTCQKPRMVWASQGHSWKDEQALRWKQAIFLFSLDKSMEQLQHITQLSLSCLDKQTLNPWAGSSWRTWRSGKRRRWTTCWRTTRSWSRASRGKLLFSKFSTPDYFFFPQESCRYERCDWGSQSRVWRDDGEDGVWSNIERLSFDKVRVSSIVKVWITSAISIE